jgi:hypothetical protein
MGVNFLYKQQYPVSLVWDCGFEMVDLMLVGRLMTTLRLKLEQKAGYGNCVDIMQAMQYFYYLYLHCPSALNLLEPITVCF